MESTGLTDLLDVLVPVYVVDREHNRTVEEGRTVQIGTPLTRDALSRLEVTSYLNSLGLGDVWDHTRTPLLCAMVRQIDYPPLSDFHSWYRATMPFGTLCALIEGDAHYASHKAR